MVRNRSSVLKSASAAIAMAIAALVAAPPAASAAGLDDAASVRFPSGQTWRGNLGDTVEVAFVEVGVPQTIVGTLLRADRRLVQVEGEIAGRVAVKTILVGDVRSMVSIGAASPSPAPSPGDRPRTPAAGGGSPAAAPAAPSPSANSEWPGVFYLPLSGTLGIGMRHDEIEAIGREADKFGPGQIIVLHIDSPGGLVIEGDKVSDTINRIKKNHRVVAWIKEAISGGAFTALHCDENYYMSYGALGAITMFSGQTAASGPQLQAWLERCGEVAEAGGRNRWVVQAMIHAPLMVSYDRDEETGKITYYNTMEGKYVLSDEVNNLTLNATNALHSGYSQGTADSVEELAGLMQLPEWKEAADGVGRRIHDDWQRTVKQAQSEVPKLIQRLNYQGSGSGDPSVVLGSRIRILEELIRWYDRCYPVVVYEMNLPQDPEPLRRQLVELRRQMAQMRQRP
jgi:hypothetical protein